MFGVEGMASFLYQLKEELQGASFFIERKKIQGVKLCYTYKGNRTLIKLS